MGLLDRLGTRRPPGAGVPEATPASDASVFATKALRKFLATLVTRDAPVLLDLGPVVGSNVTFLGEQLGCKILVEDLFADVERHVRGGTLDAFPEFLRRRFPQAAATVDGVLCWDLIDYLDRASAQALADQVVRLLRPDGAVLGFFGTVQNREPCFTKYVIVDPVHLSRRSYPSARPRQAVLLNRDIIKLFGTLRVSDSFLLHDNLREILFRKPA